MAYQPPSEFSEDYPWIVFADRADVYTEMSRESEVLGKLLRGASLSGTLLIGPEKEIEWLKTSFEGRDAFLLRCYLMRPHPANLATGDIPIGHEFVNRWWGLPLEYEPSDLVSIPTEFGYEKERIYRLRKPAADALLTMIRAAHQDGLDIRICSDYRSGPRQRDIYIKAIAEDGPEQRYSAPPGHSEHQLGTTADLVDAEGKWLFSQEMDQHPEGKWLEKNAPAFGFRRSYYPHNVPETGYISEPWHWRFVGKA